MDEHGTIWDELQKLGRKTNCSPPPQTSYTLKPLWNSCDVEHEERGFFQIDGASGLQSEEQIEYDIDHREAAAAKEKGGD